MRHDRAGHPNRKTDGPQQPLALRGEEAHTGADVAGREMQNVALCDRELGQREGDGGGGAEDHPHAVRQQSPLETARHSDGFGVLFARWHRLASQPEVQVHHQLSQRHHEQPLQLF